MRNKSMVKRCKARKRDLNSAIELPEDYPWKVLGALQNDLGQFIPADDNDLLIQIIRDRDLDAYLMLDDMWGLQNLSKSSMSGEATTVKVRAHYQLAALLKKYQFNTDKDKRKAKALETFYKAEALSSDYNRSGYKSLCFAETEFSACVFTYAKSWLQKVLSDGCPSMEILTRWSRHGPGSNLDTKKGQSNIFNKYENWPYSCTKAAIPYARFLISTDKRWLGALEDSYRARFKIPVHAILDQETFWAKVLMEVEGNRIDFVPKNALTERSIAIEPAMNLMLQLGVDGHIRTRLKRWDIDLDSQMKNQEFARLGSCSSGPDSYATLDLSMASDCMSLKLCEILLDRQWFNYLKAIRSPKGTIGNDTISYEKMSSMGNGFTFALESAIFASLIYGVIRATSGTCNFKEDMSVFGDDLITKQKYIPRVISALNDAGFKLNLDKSFTAGRVKESCGADWYFGKPIRPIYLTTSPASVQDLFVDFNRSKRILELRYGLVTSQACQKIKKWIPDQFHTVLGPYSDEDFDAYLHHKLPPSNYDAGMWRFPRLIKKSKRMSVDRPSDFFLRKLMHDLRGLNIQPKPFLKRKRKEYSNGGSRFTVYRSNAYTVGKTYSETSVWVSDYAE